MGLLFNTDFGINTGTNKTCHKQQNAIVSIIMSVKARCRSKLTLLRFLFAQKLIYSRR